MIYEFKIDDKVGWRKYELAEDEFKIYGSSKTKLIFHCPYHEIVGVHLFPPSKELYQVQIRCAKESFDIYNRSVISFGNFVFHNEQYSDFIKELHQKLIPYQTEIEFRQDLHSLVFWLSWSSCCIMVLILLLILIGGIKIIINQFSTQRLIAGIFYLGFISFMLYLFLLGVFHGIAQRNEKYYLPTEIPPERLPTSSSKPEKDLTS